MNFSATSGNQDAWFHQQAAKTGHLEYHLLKIDRMTALKSEDIGMAISYNESPKVLQLAR